MIVLDTHVLLWWLGGERSRIPARTVEIIETELSRGEVVASSITSWEVSLLVTRGKIDLLMDVFSWLDVASQIEGFKFLPLDNIVAAKSVMLPGDFHSDPADRIIVALARELGVPLVTADDKIRRYQHVKTIW